MGNGLLSRVNWGGTLVFMLMRIAFGTIGFFILFSMTGGVLGGNILGLPFVIAMFSGLALVAAWLSQAGVPFAGLFNIVFSIPMYVGDPMIWVLHKIRPQWVPVREPAFINPPFVWVLND